MRLILEILRYIYVCIYIYVYASIIIMQSVVCANLVGFIVAVSLYSAQCVSKIKPILSIIFYAAWAVCFRFTLALTVRIHVFYLIIIFKSDAWIIRHCLELGHETIICTGCLYSSWLCHQMETFSVLLALCAVSDAEASSDAELWYFLWCAPE